MTIAVLVIIAGVAVGLVIDVVLTRRHRARRLASPDADAVAVPLIDPAVLDAAERRQREEAITILGPVEYDPPEVPSVEWDLESDPFHDDPFEPPARGD